MSTISKNDQAIRAQGLTRRFGNLVAVDYLNLEVAYGEAFALVGPDAAGKTTTMRLLVGALTPDSGAALVAGYDLGRQTEQARAQLGYLAQRFSLYGDLTVLENLEFFGRVRGMAAALLRAR